MVVVLVSASMSMTMTATAQLSQILLMVIIKMANMTKVKQWIHIPITIMGKTSQLKISITVALRVP